ncbi:MAG TPA: amidohydrolase family protein [Planctomycetota bacterium]|nr:amidohydrolase family protein [Planctomycetota bacterium]
MRFLALVLSVLVQAQETSQPKPVVLRGARIYTGTGPALDGALIVIEHGRIAAVGKEIPIPPGAEIVDGTGKVVIPGLIDAASRLFVPVSGERSAGSPDQRVLDGLDFFQTDADEAVQQGVTTVYVGPVSTGPINGLGAIIHLNAARTVLQKEAALKMTLGASSGESSSALERYQSFPQLKQAFEAARQYLEDGEKYRRDLAAYEQAQKDKKTTDLKPPSKPKVDLKQEVVARCLDPKSPLTLRIEVHAADAIPLALRLVEEYKLKAVLEYVTEGGEVAAAIAKARVPALVGPVFRTGPPSVDYLRHSPQTASVLSRAGVSVAVGSFADERAGALGPGGSRFLAESAAAAARGFTREQTLAMITIEAAKILGLEKTQGSIEKDKVADLVLLSGEPFESTTRVDRTWIDGVTVYARGKR